MSNKNNDIENIEENIENKDLNTEEITSDNSNTSENITTDTTTDDNTESIDSTTEETQNESSEIEDTPNIPSLNDFMGNGNDVFTTFKQKYENTMSSAIILLFFGCLGVISTILFATGVIKSAISTFQYIFLTILYIIFIVYGVISYLKALDYKEKISKESSDEENIKKYLDTNISEKYLNKIHDDELSEEENYVIYISSIKDDISKEYPEYDTKLIEYLTDDYLNEHF